MSRKWYYYGFKETGYIWKQKEPLNGNPSAEYHLWILDKKEAEEMGEVDKIKKWYYYYHPESDCLWKQNVKLEDESPKLMSEVNRLTRKEAIELSDSPMQLKIETQIINLKPEKMGKKNKKNKKNKNTGSKNAKVIRSLDGSIALSKLKHVMMNKKGKKGRKVRCIVIPVKDNFLFESKDGGLYLNIRVNLKDKEDEFNQHGFIGQSVPSDIYKAASDKEKEKMKKTPILGGLKDWNYESSNDNSGSAGSDIDDDDDLPF